MKYQSLPEEFWHDSTLNIARHLLGKVLISDLGGARTAGRIVETEGYIQEDPASHSHRGQTPRNTPMFGLPGRAYVYFTYGNHWLLNFTTCPEGRGEAALIRALEPLDGLEIMAARRGRSAPHDLLSGPGKICQAMAIGKQQNSHDLNLPPLMLIDDGWEPGEIIERPRVGLSVSGDKLWRFYPLRSLEWVSRK